MDIESKNIIYGAISNQGIREVFFSMGALKAPSPNKFHSLFYLSQLEHVGKLVCQTIKDNF